MTDWVILELKGIKFTLYLYPDPQRMALEQKELQRRVEQLAAGRQG